MSEQANKRISDTSAGGYVDFSRFSTMRSRAHRDGDGTMQQVADEFEAMFAELMLKAAREADNGDGMFDSSELDTYHELLDSQLAQSLAKNQDFGFSTMLTQQFAGELAQARVRAGAGTTSVLPKTATLNSIEAPLRGGITTLPPALRATVFGKRGDLSVDRQAFVDEIAPTVRLSERDKFPVHRGVKLGRNKSMLVEISRDLRDVIVSNPEIMDAVVQSSNRVYLIGKKVGQSNVFFFDSNGEQIATFEVVIEHDTAPLDALYARLIPGSRIKAEIMNETVILTGSVRNPSDSTRAADIASRSRRC